MSLSFSENLFLRKTFNVFTYLIQKTFLSKDYIVFSNNVFFFLYVHSGQNVTILYDFFSIHMFFSLFSWLRTCHNICLKIVNYLQWFFPCTFSFYSVLLATSLFFNWKSMSFLPDSILCLDLWAWTLVLYRIFNYFIHNLMCRFLVFRIFVLLNSL